MVKRIRPVLAVMVVMVAILAFASSTAFAGHAHYLDTPGTCVEDIASGQTSQTSGSGAHKFHENVHKGPSDDPATPGEFAFAQGGQVEVGKGSCPPE